ncbi:MAG: PH domain-containing protein [Pseudomonadota bacterium]
MLYIQQSLGEDEQLIHVARFHWMYDVMAVFNLLFFIALAFGVMVAAIIVEPILFGSKQAAEIGLFNQIKGLHPGVLIVSLLVLLMGVLKFAQTMIVKATTEIAVTSNRLSYKRGLVARYVGEINVDRIEGVNVLQGVLGRIFGYGRVLVRGTGVGDILLPPIEQPIRFRKAIETARKKDKDKSYDGN